MGKTDVNVMTGTKVPALRFKGFNDEWVEKKLGEFSTISNGSGDVQDANLTSGLYPFFDRSTVIKYVDEYNYDTHGIIYPGEGSKFYPKIYKGKFGLHQRAYVIYDLDETITNIEFIYQSMSLMNNYFLRMSVGSTVPSLRRDVFEKAKVELPELEEQVAIGQLFKSVDYLIITEEQKLEQLNALKKSFLQKMFPKKGATVPELRFDGFSGDWVEKKLGDVFIDGFSGGTPKTSNSEYYGGSIPFLSISDMDGKYIQDTEKHITELGLDSSSAKLVPAGSITLSMYASVGKVGMIESEISTSQAFYNMVFDDADMREYVYTYLILADEFNLWERLISTGTQRNLNAGKVRNFSMVIPGDDGEVKFIGQFFKTFDELIEKQKEKVENAEEMKKALLQKMFV